MANKIEYTDYQFLKLIERSVNKSDKAYARVSTTFFEQTRIHSLKWPELVIFEDQKDGTALVKLSHEGKILMKYMNCP